MMCNKIKTFYRSIVIVLVFFHVMPAMSMTGMMYEYNKMANSVLNKICQDKYGFIWIGSEFGLSKFDGYHFVNYYHVGKDNNSIASNQISVLTCSSDGTMFIGCSKGLMRYDYSTDGFIRYTFPLPVQPRISSITEISKNKFLVSTSGYGVYEVDKSTNQVVKIKSFEKITGNRYLSFFTVERGGYVWISTSDGRLLRAHLQGTKLTDVMKVDNKGERPIGIIENEKGKILLFFADRVVDFNIYTRKLDSFDLGLPKGTSISAVYRSSDNTLYISTVSHGLYVVKNGCQKAQPEVMYDGRYLLNGVRANSIMQDKGNNLWMTCPSHGLYFCSMTKQKFNSLSFIYEGEKLSTGISSIAPSEDGRLLCVASFNGLFELDKNGVAKKCQGAPQNASFIYQDKHGTYWLGTWSSIYTYDAKHATATLVKDFYNKGVLSIAEDLEGHIYASVLGDGFVVFDKDKKILKHYSTHNQPKKKGAKFGNDWVGQMYCDHKGLMWIPTASGFWCYDPYRDVFVNTGDGDGLMRETYISAICELPNYNLVIGTQNGLYLYLRDSQKITRLPGGEALDDMTISSLVRDNDGNIWISTPRGIWQYLSNQHKLISYMGVDGIVEEEFCVGSSYQTHDGMLYLGALSAVTYFNPSDLKKKEHFEGQVYLTRATSLSQVYDPFSSTIIIPWDDNRLTLEFSLLDYKNASNVSFEYRINGGEWMTFENEGNVLTFTKLKSGTYQLDIRASKSGIYIAGSKHLKLVVQAPWYASTLAQVFYLLLAILLVYLCAWYFYRRQKAAFKEEKMKLLINATHDIRSPLTMILGPMDKLKQLVEKSCSDESRKDIDQYVDTINRNAERLMLLVNQILDMRKIDKQQMNIKCQETDIVSFVKNVTLSFEFAAKQRDITLDVVSDEEKVLVWIDHENFDKVMVNLLSNAFKYTSDGGEVLVFIRHDENEVTIQVVDSGIGIGNEKTSKLFERFYQGNKAVGKVGTGIGLNLALSIVQLHGGSIVASNRDDGKQGACFAIKLPLGKSHLKTENIYEVSRKNTARKGMCRKGNILLVDDDTELLAYVSRELKPWYHVDQCTNGMDALQALLSQEYELMVSDVMMPGMDGIALLKKVKQNPNTNHIPVILLTSKSEVADRMEGFRSGADAYLAKPFHVEELHARIDNLIENMHRLKGKFTGSQQQQDKVQPVDVKSNDEELMERIMKSVNAHIDDSEYNVESLVKDVGMSRVQLHRKMKELTGVSTAKFIRNIRMEQACRLIGEGKVNISQVAYAVGFSDQAYFSTVFKQYYGMSPSDYAKKFES